jgi:chloramphenicol O-acetyltransferase type A
MYTLIDQENWVRRDLFSLFKSYDNPTWDLLSEVRITDFYRGLKEKEGSFFLSFLYAATRVCNNIRELRCRIDLEGQVRQYDVVHPGSTILYDNGTYGFGYFTYHPEYPQFIADAKPELELQKNRKNVDSKDDDLARLYFSPIPWVSFTGFRHPFRRSGNISIPLIVFGKHFERGGDRFLSVGLTLHHGLADGYHAGLFFTQLQELLDKPDFLL